MLGLTGRISARRLRHLRLGGVLQNSEPLNWTLGHDLTGADLRLAELLGAPVVDARG
jgi:hypothetical protein